MGALGRRVFMLVALVNLSACKSKEPVNAQDAVSESLPALSLQVAPTSVERFEITQPGAEPVMVSLSGGQWNIDAPLVYPAKMPSIESILAVLAEIEIVRRVAPQPEPKHRLADDARVVVKTWTKQGVENAFAIGASSREETFVQRLGEEQVYAVRGSCRRFFDLSLAQLRAPAITNLDLAEIEAVRFVGPSEALSLVASSEQPRMFVEESPSISNFNRERASKSVAVVARLFAKDFVDPPIDRLATGLFEDSTPYIEVSTRGGAKPLKVYIGARTTNGRLYLRTSDSEQIYLVSAHLGSSLMPRNEHFERTDSEMRALKRHTETADTGDEKSSHSAEHKHGNTRPTKVPPELMAELRDLANEQRH